MENNGNWYRQLAALALLAASRAAVEFITNPNSREDAGKQLKDAFASIDYETLAQQLTSQIDVLAESSKGRLSDTIDTLRDTSMDAVEQAKNKAQATTGAAPKKKGRKMRFLLGLIIGGLAVYYLFDEQRRDDLLDKLTGASGPIQQAPQSWGQPSGGSQSSPSTGTSSDATSSTDKPAAKNEA